MNAQSEVKVWDPAVRLFHWSLVAAFFIAYFTEGEDWLNLHVNAGYVVLGLVAFRILWGFIGTQHARFSDFVFSPAVVISHTRQVLSGTARRFLGHNPAGGAMIILLLICVLATSITGVAVYGADQQVGPLAGMFAGAVEGGETEKALEEIHEFLANFTVLLVALHVLGVIVESRLHKESLLLAMITGRKRA